MTEKRYIRCDAEDHNLPDDATDYAIVYDPSTNLEWFADFLPKEIRHSDTDKACSDQTLAGGGWRMPDLAEAESIRDIMRYNPARDPAFRGPDSGWMWTSSRVASDPEGSAWLVTLNGGSTYISNRNGTAWVRPCRARVAPSQ